MDKVAIARKYLSEYSSAVVAFSGGVDSSTLAALCRDVLADVLAVTVVAPNIPSREINEARRIAGEIGVEHELLEIDLLNNEDFVRNDAERCYYCKKHLLTKLSELAVERGYETVFEGTNADDALDHRPGLRAIREIEGVRSPWLELGFSKEDIRAVARELGYSFHSKPSLACLATRIPHGVRIDAETLAMVDEAENTVIKLANVEQVRVRKFGSAAVIEVERRELDKLLAVKEDVTRVLRDIGFQRVLVDLEGYRSGKGAEL